jgi:hypothetical protein
MGWRGKRPRLRQPHSQAKARLRHPSVVCPTKQRRGPAGCDRWSARSVCCADSLCVVRVTQITESGHPALGAARPDRRFRVRLPPAHRAFCVAADERSGCARSERAFWRGSRIRRRREIGIPEGVDGVKGGFAGSCGVMALLSRVGFCVGTRAVPERGSRLGGGQPRRGVAMTPARSGAR